MNDNNLNDVLKNIGAESVPDDVAELARNASQDFKHQLRQHRRPRFTEQIMKSPFTKLAAAAAVTIAALIGLGVFTSSSITYADVIKPILNAKTVILDIVIGDDPDAVVIHDIVVESKIRRTLSNMDGVMVLDLDNDKMLMLYTPGKTAIEVDIAGPVKEGTKDFLKMVRTIVEETKNDPDVTELGEQQIDGQTAVGFQLNDASGLTIWADPDTALPIRIEITIGGERTILKNIEFNTPVDPSLVSMEVPEGYTMQSQSFDMTQFTEQDFIETLRIWAEIINDGVFPDEVTSEAQMKTMPKFIEKLSQQSGLTPEQMTEMGVKFGRGMIFYQGLTVNGQWQYSGKGVKFGDATKEVARFQTEGSNTWRVIYGDLSIKDAN